MVTLTVARARAELCRLVDGAGDEPVRIVGERGSAVLVSEEDWSAIQETLNLLSVPGMRESIWKGLKMPVRKCKGELRW